MSNHAFANCRGLRPGVLFAAFCEGMNEALLRFHGAARITERTDEAVRVVLYNPPDQDEVYRATFWNSGKKVEWAHSLAKVDFWIQDTLAAIACRSAAATLGKTVYLTDEGIDGKMVPKFDIEFPLLSDWMLGTGLSRKWGIPGPYLAPAHAATEILLDSLPSAHERLSAHKIIAAG